MPVPGARRAPDHLSPGLNSWQIPGKDRRMRLAPALVLLSAVLFSSSRSARADGSAGQQPAVASTALPIRYSLQFGLGAPLGFVGAAWALAPTDWLRLEGGIGAGYSGAQVSLMPTIVFGSGRKRFVSGAGIAWTAFQACASMCAWINVEAVGYEVTTRSGNTVFVGAGLAMLLQNSGGGRGSLDAFVPIPQFRVGVGSWSGGLPGDEHRGASTGSKPLSRRHRVLVHAGLGDPAPMGHLGLSYTFAFSNLLRIELGAGPGTGAHVAAVPSLALGSERNTFVIGAGLGIKRSDHEFDYPCAKACAVLVMDLVGYEHVFLNGFSVTFAAGTSMLLNRQYRSFLNDQPDLSTGYREMNPQIRGGLGWWF
jgi:hypothetical protein